MEKLETCPHQANICKFPQPSGAIISSLEKTYHFEIGNIINFKAIFPWDRRIFLNWCMSQLNKPREGLLWRSRRLLSTKAEGRGGFTTVSLLHNFATFEFVWVSSYGCAEAHVHIRLAAYWQSPKLAPLEGARNTLKDFFLKRLREYFQWFIESNM